VESDIVKGPLISFEYESAGEHDNAEYSQVSVVVGLNKIKIVNLLREESAGVSKLAARLHTAKCVLRI
jgi:hypothetical protein